MASEAISIAVELSLLALPLWIESGSYFYCKFFVKENIINFKEKIIYWIIFFVIKKLVHSWAEFMSEKLSGLLLKYKQFSSDFSS